MSIRPLPQQKTPSQKPSATGFASDRGAHRGLARRELSLNAASAISSHFNRDFSGIPTHPPLAGMIQTKLTISQSGDQYEQEAESVSVRVMRMEPRLLQRSCACGGTCPKCQAERKTKHDARIQMKRVGSTHSGQTNAPPSVHQVLRSPGQQLDATTRAFMEPRFGQDFSGVRVHSDRAAAESARDVNARAYTVGRDVVFGDGSYAPGTNDGRRLLAHELAHVVQQQKVGSETSLQRFELSEKPQIAPTFNDMLAQIKTLIDAATTPGIIWDDLNMSFLVEIAGGSSAGRKFDKAIGSTSPTIKSRLLTRYLFTCRCGLIDMRHFFQTFYISNFFAGLTGTSQAQANRTATKKGREHELESTDSQSRFAAEDTTSNALGAFTNIGLAATPPPDRVFDAIKKTLTRCDPVDFNALSAASQDAIVHYYGDRIPDPAPKKPGDQIPKAQSQTAVPAVLGITECGGKERSFPFSLDKSDADKKTLGDTAFGKGSTTLRKGSDIRDFINTQRPEVLRAMATSDKIRMMKVLLGGEVSKEDLAAATLLGSMMNAAETAEWKTNLPLATDD
jgi:hypothetical protein